MKIINVAKTTNSNRGLKQPTPQEQAHAQKLIDSVNFKYCTIVIEIGSGLYACKMPIARVFSQIALNGKRAKILCPLGKSQVLEFIASGDLEKIGQSSDLEKYHNNPRYKVSNNGHAIEYFLAQKAHTKFDHNGKMLGGSGEFRNTEVKFFSFDKTTGTPSATCC